jgi:cytoplasmic tRNA 2-thiolation protein 2
MCSLQPDSWEIQASERTTYKQLMDSSKCVKCKIQDAKIFLRDANYCNTCFLTVFSHKLRMTIGKAFKYFPEERSVNEKRKILVAMDESINSSVLLDALLEPYLSAPTRPCPFEFIAVHIDTSLSETTSFKSLDSIKEKYKVDAHIFQLSASYSPNINVPNYEALKKLLDVLPTETLRASAYKVIMNDFIYRVALYLDCKTVFLAVGSQENAINLITNVAIGKGYTLPIDTAPYSAKKIDGRSMTVVKPLRDITRQEIESYAELKQLTSLFDHSGAPATHQKSIQDLTKEFLIGLQREFPATLSTVTRTGDKVATEWRMAMDESVETCILCQSRIQRGAHRWRDNMTIYQAATAAKSAETEKATLCYSCSYLQPYLSYLPSSTSCSDINLK